MIPISVFAMVQGDNASGLARILCWIVGVSITAPRSVRWGTCIVWALRIGVSLGALLFLLHGGR